MSSLWFPARSVSTAAVHAQRGPLNRLAVPWWKWPSCRPRVMRLPAVGIIEVWNRLGKWNIISLVILTTWLNLWCDLNSLETLPSATNCIGSGAVYAPETDSCPFTLPGRSAELVTLGMLSKEKSDSYVPSWDGSSRTWRRYCKEVAWFMGGTKANHRQYAAAKLITRLTGAARLLSMSWHNRDFMGEQGVSKMLRCFAASPLVRRSLPNAASTMSEYFSFRRRPNEPIAQFLVREALGFEEFQEALLQLKEERDGLDPSQRQFDLPEITGLSAGSSGAPAQDHEPWWNGRWGEWRGVIHGDDEDDGEPVQGDAGPSQRPDGYAEVPQTSDPGSPVIGPSEQARRQNMDGSPTQSPSRKVATHRKPHGADDVLSPMDSFILDVMRGWRLLVAACLSSDEWRDVLASTGNKLDYQSIADALQVLWDEQLGRTLSSPSSFHHNHWVESWPSDGGAYYEQQYNWLDDGWNSSDWGDSNYSTGDAFAAHWNDSGSPSGDVGEMDQPDPDDPALKEAMDAERSAEAMFNEARRTWSQAQQATASLRRDRGFGQHAHDSGKGKGKCFNCGGNHYVWDCPDRLHPGPRKGVGKHLSQAELDAYLLKGKGKGKPKGLHMASWDDVWYGDSYENYGMFKGKGKYGKNVKGKYKPSLNTYVMDYDYHSAYCLELFPLELFSTSQPSTTGPQRSVPLGFGMLDCGATASAGPESSAKLLISKLREIDPQIGVHLDDSRRPYFRYGSGQWGRSLYHLTLVSAKNPARTFEMYTLPDPDGFVYGWSSPSQLVPILVGMDHLQKIGLVLDFSDGFALHGAEPEAEPYCLHKNPKGHFMIDLVYYLCGVISDAEAIDTFAATMDGAFASIFRTGILVLVGIGSNGVDGSFSCTNFRFTTCSSFTWFSVSLWSQKTIVINNKSWEVSSESCDVWDCFPWVPRASPWQLQRALRCLSSTTELYQQILEILAANQHGLATALTSTRPMAATLRALGRIVQHAAWGWATFLDKVLPQSTWPRMPRRSSPMPWRCWRSTWPGTKSPMPAWWRLASGWWNLRWRWRRTRPSWPWWRPTTKASKLISSCSLPRQWPSYARRTRTRPRVCCQCWPETKLPGWGRLLQNEFKCFPCLPPTPRWKWSHTRRHTCLQAIHEACWWCEPFSCWWSFGWDWYEDG